MLLILGQSWPGGRSVPGVPAADQLRDSRAKEPKIRPLNQTGTDNNVAGSEFFSIPDPIFSITDPGSALKNLSV